MGTKDGVTSYAMVHVIDLEYYLALNLKIHATCVLSRKDISLAKIKDP